jgi:hypothetical protein
MALRECVTMATCLFDLNNQLFSSFVCDFGSYPAFSGKGSDRNNPDSVGKVGQGPIPLGNYYIVDRVSGGWLGDVLAWYSDKDLWFALYRDDGTIDDETFVDAVRRGQFRLHPGRNSLGCITLQYPMQFAILRGFLLAQPVEYIPGTKTRTYGTVWVSKAERVPMLDQRYRRRGPNPAAEA